MFTPDGDDLRSVEAAAHKVSLSHWVGRTVSGSVGMLNFRTKFCRLPEISLSDGRGQNLRNKLCLARVWISQSRPFKRFGLNWLKKISAEHRYAKFGGNRDTLNCVANQERAKDTIAFVWPRRIDSYATWPNLTYLGHRVTLTWGQILNFIF